MERSWKFWASICARTRIRRAPSVKCSNISTRVPEPATRITQMWGGLAWPVRVHLCVGVELLLPGLRCLRGDSRSILSLCPQRERPIMYWSSSAERGITPIATLPSRSIWSTSRQWQRSPNFIFTGSSQRPTAEPRRRIFPHEELNERRIFSARQTSR
jgi:hypothetical protein